MRCSDRRGPALPTRVRGTRRAAVPLVIRIGARATEGEELFGILVRGALTPHVHGTDARAFTVGGGTALHVGQPARCVPQQDAEAGRNFLLGALGGR